MIFDRLSAYLGKSKKQELIMCVFDKFGRLVNQKWLGFKTQCAKSCSILT